MTVPATLEKDGVTGEQAFTGPETGRPPRMPRSEQARHLHRAKREALFVLASHQPRRLESTVFDPPTHHVDRNGDILCDQLDAAGVIATCRIQIEDRIVSIKDA